MLKQKKVEKKIFAEIDSSVETYKKIGLFDELDDRYEDPDAAAAAALNGTTPSDDDGGAGGGGGGGGGGGSILGGGLGGGIDMGAGVGSGAGAGEEVPGAEAGTEAGAEPGAETPEEENPEEKEPTAPIKESAIIKHLKSSDRRMDHFINELRNATYGANGSYPINQASDNQLIFFSASQGNNGVVSKITNGCFFKYY